MEGNRITQVAQEPARHCDSHTKLANTLTFPAGVEFWGQAVFLQSHCSAGPPRQLLTSLPKAAQQPPSYSPPNGSLRPLLGPQPHPPAPSSTPKLSESQSGQCLEEAVQHLTNPAEYLHTPRPFVLRKNSFS